MALSSFTPFTSHCGRRAAAARPGGGRAVPAAAGVQPVPADRAVAARVAAFEGCRDPLPRPIKVVGCGSSGVDYLASIASYPKPDQKLRTDALEVQGGGNCANALTAAARLGLSPTIVTKIGGDGLGDGIISELEGDGVDTQLVLRAAGHPSPFTYIIVDREGGTRTCIHTPGAPMAPEEMTEALVAAALEGAALVYFDGRLTEAALLLARAARAAGVPVLVEGERLRPGLQDLLAEADYVVTSAHFPQEWTGEQCVGDALLEVAARLPNARMIVTTRGTKGSVCLLRQQAGAAEEAGCLQDVIDGLSAQLAQQQPGDGAAVCVSSGGVEILPARVASTAGALRLQFSSSRDGAAARASAERAASEAAALNADAANAQGYGMAAAATPTPDQQQARQGCAAQVFVATAAALPQSAVADTTGAGDSFIGSVLYGLTTGMAPDRILQLGAAVAACKCTALGARPGLPRREQLAPQLLQ